MKKAYHCEREEHRQCGGYECRCWCHLFDKGVWGFGQAMGRLLNVPWSWFLNVFPLTRMAKHRAEIKSVTEKYERQIRQIRSAHQQELGAERKLLSEILPKLVKITPGYAHSPHGGGRFTVATQLSEDFVYQVLSSGDRRAFDYIAENMAHEMRRQMATIDFARVRAAANYDDQRRGRMSPWAMPDGPSFRG